MPVPPQNVVELLSALVQIPSVNPDGDPGVETVGELACAEYVGSFLKEIGAAVELQTVFPDRPNVIGRFPADRVGKPRVIFAPHLDTVSVVGMDIEPFSGAVNEGRVWGRGASDTKGTMAAILWALKEMREELPSLKAEIWFAGLMSEETGQYGAKAFVEAYCKEAPEKTFALIGEPTEETIVHAHKGACRLKIVTHGVAVHGSTPERGENAIMKMVPVLQYLETVIGPRLQERENPVLGRATVNIGTIRGGSKSNIVPDFCEVMVDIRTIPELYSSEGGSVGACLKRELEETFPGLTVDFSDSLPLWTDPNHPMIQQLERCGKRPGGAPWYCDAAIFSQAGVPAVAAGPGSIAQAHTKDEFLAVADLEDGVRFYRQFLEGLR